MPNWKSYEASVRLLSAIIAAHPTLKLNYDEIGRFYGGGTKYKSVWDRMTQLTRYAESLKDAVERGDDPINVELAEGAAQGSKPRAKDISKRFGGDCTKSALENRFRRIKSDAKLINDAVAQGIDIITVNVGDTDGAAAMGGAKDVARCFGDGVKGASLKAQMNRHIGRNVKLINDALERCDDPGQVALGGLFGKYDSKEGNEIAECMGKDVTAKALEWQMWSKFKQVAKLQLAARKAGQDPQFVNVEATAMAAKGNKEVARIMGSDVTSNGLRFQVADKLKPLGKLQLDALQAGLDPKDVATSVTAKSSKDIAMHMGSDVTKGAIEWQFRRFKIGGKLQRQAVKNGIDPSTINVDVNVKEGAEAKLKHEDFYIARCLNDDTTASALEHRFRPIKKEAAVMAAAIAGSYQQGITGEGGSTTSTPAKTPRGKRGPNKKTPKAESDADEVDDEESDFGTPSKKKSALNKVKGGRVSKPKISRKNASQSFDGDGGEDADEADKYVMSFVKHEPSMRSHGNGHSNGNGNYGGDFMGNAASFSSEQNDINYHDDDEYEDQV